MRIANPALPPTLEGSAHATPSPQLVKAANAFEANFLGELLKPMREDPLFGNGSGLGGDGLGSDGPSSGSMGTIASLASEALAQAIAKQGGLGIAKMVLAQLAPVEESASQTAAVLAGPKCGDCARQLTIGQEAATALDPGRVAMLGQGNLPAAAGGAPRNAGDKLARGAVSEQHDGVPRSMQGVRAAGSVKK
jgi:Rod binding domain-containing protein